MILERYKRLRRALALSLAFSFVMLSSATMATDLYVDPINGDNNTGEAGNMSKPFKTITKALQFTSDLEWDNIFLAPGKYRETVTMTSAHQKIIFARQPGTTGAVVVTGADEILPEAWTPVSGGPSSGIYAATLLANQVDTEYTQLFESGRLEQIARYPNNNSGQMLNPLSIESGYAIVKNGSKAAGVSTCEIYFDNKGGLSGPPSSLTNEAVFRGVIGKLRNNIFARNSPFSSHNANINVSGSKVTWSPVKTWNKGWSNSAAYSAPEGFAYILDYNCLDQEGEWFFKSSENKIYYKPVGGTVNDKVIEVQKRALAFKMSGARDITLDGIHVRAAGLDATNVKRLRILNSSFKYMRPFKYVTTYSVAGLHDGIVLDNCDDTEIDGCYIGQTWTSGISILSGSDNTTVNNCVIEEIGWLGLFTSSIFHEGGSTTITNNTFGRSARFHLRVQSRAKNIISYNEFYGAMAMGEDAGSVSYTSTTAGSTHYNLQGTEISYNIIHDILGVPSFDTSPGYNGGKAVAFYMEDVSNYTIHHNIVYDIGAQDYDRLGGGNYIVEGKILYMGPRVREMVESVTGNPERCKIYHNTFWDYTKLVTAWQMYNNGTDGSIAFNGRVEAEFKNNIYQAMTNQTDVARQRVKVTDTNQWDYDKLSGGGEGTTKGDSFADFIATMKGSPFFSTQMWESNNSALSGAKSNHFAAGVGNYTPLAFSGQFIGGEYLAGVTQSDQSGIIEIGAIEGDNEDDQNKVLTAGSTIDPTVFNIGNESDVVLQPQPETPSSIVNSEDSFFLTVYPNPTHSTIYLPQNMTNQRIQVITMTGQVVKDKVLTDNYGIDVSNLKNGIYLIQIEGIGRARFIKN